MTASNKVENYLLKNTFYNSASWGLTFLRYEQSGLGKGIPFLFGGQTKRTVLSRWESLEGCTKGCISGGLTKINREGVGF